MKIIPGKETSTEIFAVDKQNTLTIHDINAKIAKSIVTLCLIIFGYFAYLQYTKRIITHDTMRKNAICPALLSLGQTTRDTLIIMKAEPLCNSFVLENLQ